MIHNYIDFLNSFGNCFAGSCSGSCFRKIVIPMNIQLMSYTEKLDHWSELFIYFIAKELFIKCYVTFL